MHEAPSRTGYRSREAISPEQGRFPRTGHPAPVQSRSTRTMVLPNQSPPVARHVSRAAMLKSGIGASQGIPCQLCHAACDQLGESPRRCATWPATTPFAGCKAARKFQAAPVRRLKAKARGARHEQDLTNNRRDDNESTEAIGAGCSRCVLLFVIVEGDRTERLRVRNQMPRRMRLRPLRRCLPLNTSLTRMAVPVGPPCVILCDWRITHGLRD